MKKRKTGSDGLVYAVALVITALAGWFGLGEIVVNPGPAMSASTISPNNGSEQ